MSILSVTTAQTGTTGVLPGLAYITTDDTEATVLTPGYLNEAVQNGASFQLPCIAAVSTIASVGAQPIVSWYQVSAVHSIEVPLTTTWSLVSEVSPGGEVTSIIGTPNQISASSPVGNVTLNLPQNIATSSSPTFAAMTITGNESANNLVLAGTTIASAGSTTTLTSSSTYYQLITGSTTQTIIMPVVSTLKLYTPFRIDNNSSGNVTVESSGTNVIQVMAPNSTLFLLNIAITGTSASVWQPLYIVDTDVSGAVLLNPTGNQTIASYNLTLAGANFAATNVIPGYATTATAAGTTTLTVVSPQQQYFTGSTTEAVVLPVTSTLSLGQSFSLINNSTATNGPITVNASDSSLIANLLPGTQLIVTCISTSITSNSAWSFQFISNSFSPSIAYANINYTGTFTPLPMWLLANQSYEFLGTNYGNLITSSVTFPGLAGATTFDFGNVQSIGSPNISWTNLTSLTGSFAIMAGTFTLNTPNLTTFTFNNLLVVNGGVSLTSVSLTTFSLPVTQIINGTFTVTAAPNMTTINLPDVNYLISLVLTSAPSLTTITLTNLLSFNAGTNAISGTANALTTLTLTNLITMNGAYVLTANALTTLSMPALTSITGALTPVGTLLATINMPNLVTLTGAFSPTLAALTTLTLTSLTTVTGAFAPTFATLTTLSLPALTTLGAGFSPTCADVTTLTLTLLANITGAVACSFASLTTMSLPAILNMTSTFAITAANMTTFSMNAGLLSVGGNFTMTGMKLGQSSVDGILVSLANLNGSGGTTAYSSHTVNLSGGTSSTPSATGLTAKATLVARGCTVTTN